jgi:hypothetical protein
MHTASLIPRVDSEYPFEIVLNALDPLPRQRFSIAHELGHTFFYDRSLEPPARLLRIGGKAEERFCDEFAGELLLPNENIPEDAGPTLLVRLAERFLVSVQVVAWRAMRRQKWLAILGLSWKGSRRKPDDIALRVDWLATPPGTWVPVDAKYRSGPALELGESGFGAGISDLALGSLRGEFMQQAGPLPDGGVLLMIEPLETAKG